MAASMRAFSAAVSRSASQASIARAGAQTPKSSLNVLGSVTPTASRTPLALKKPELPKTPLAALTPKTPTALSFFMEPELSHEPERQGAEAIMESKPYVCAPRMPTILGYLTAEQPLARERHVNLGDSDMSADELAERTREAILSRQSRVRSRNTSAMSTTAQSVEPRSSAPSMPTLLGSTNVEQPRARERHVHFGDISASELAEQAHEAFLARRRRVSDRCAPGMSSTSQEPASQVADVLESERAPRMPTLLGNFMVEQPRVNKKHVHFGDMNAKDIAEQALEALHARQIRVRSRHASFCI